MPNGMTPYDKKSYRDSKKRRKQALIADKTGKILPISSYKYRILVIVVLLICVIASVIAGVFIYKYYFSQQHDKKNNSDISVSDREKLLIDVDRNNPLESDYVPELSDFNGIKVNSTICDDLSGLVDFAYKEGIQLNIKSGYISFEEQKELHETMLNEFLKNSNYTQVRAEAAVGKIVPCGGQSEAQTGLLVEFDVSNTEVSSFLERVCVDYGFVLRFPEDKQDITGMNPSDSVYRYVGVENSIKMRSYDMCLEEYNKYLNIQKNVN